MGFKTEMLLALLKTRHFLSKKPVFFKNYKEFEGKRVIIIGPATSSLTYLPGNKIDEFDYIVRINNGILIADKIPEKIGGRTDILFHCVTQCSHHGFRSLSPDLLKKQSVKYVFYPHARRKATRKFYQFAQKHPEVPLFRTDPSLWHDVHSEHTAKEPTTGLMALVFFLRLNLAELHITGFTFYRTNYVENYTSEASGEAALKNMKNFTVHNPQEDFVKFVKEYKRALSFGKKVILDQELLQIVQESGL